MTILTHCGCWQHGDACCQCDEHDSSDSHCDGHEKCSIGIADVLPLTIALLFFFALFVVGGVLRFTGITSARRERSNVEAARLIAEIKSAELWLKDYGTDEINQCVGRALLEDLRQQLNRTGVPS